MSDYKYSFNSVVRYSEADTTGNLSVHGIINYMQDCSTFQSEAIGVGMRRLQEKKRAWLLAGWDIVIERPASVGAHIKISTWSCGFRSIYGDRCFTIEDVGGNVYAKASSLWVYIDTERRHPVKIDDEELGAYIIGGEMPVEPAQRKLPVPDKLDKLEPFKIRKEHLDTNGHVNNAWHITISADYLPENFDISRIRAVYQREIVCGSMVYPHVSCGHDKTVVVLEDPEGRRYSVTEFYKRTEKHD